MNKGLLNFYRGKKILIIIGNRLVVGFIGNPFAQRMVRLVQAARKAKQASCYVFDIAEFIGRKV